MAKRKVTKKPNDYHEAQPMVYTGNGEYIINIPARDLSVIDVVETAARLDMSLGAFVGMVSVIKNKHGENLYIIPIEEKPIVESNGDDNSAEDESHG